MFPEESLTKFFLSHVSRRICCHNSLKGAIGGKREMHLLLLLLLSLSFSADIVDRNVLVMGLL
jgi:hypothetical protein